MLVPVRLAILAILPLAGGLSACPDTPATTTDVAEVLGADAADAAQDDTPSTPDPGGPDLSPDAPRAKDVVIDTYVPPCGGYTGEGCCSATGTVSWCEDDQIWEYDCTQDDLTCGWIDGVGFDCTSRSVGSNDPAFPFQCPGETCGTSCKDRECGDACGEFCGDCAAGDSCNDAGKCEPCTCDGKSCGDDGCGNSCGGCGAGLKCEVGQCVPCTCAGIECGDNGCGTNCGGCGLGKTCSGGFCQGDCAAVQEIQGCCEGLWLKWCEGGEYFEKLCKDSCGWDGTNGWHECDFVGEDPSATYAYTCGGGSPGPPDGVPDGPVETPPEATPDTADSGQSEIIGDVGDAAPETMDAGPDAAADAGADVVTLSCANVPAEGCCTPAGLIYWCDGSLQVNDCVGSLGWSGCGWDTGIGEYDCSDQQVSSGNASLPWLCPGTSCESACDTKQCGFECGESCGTCASGQTCNASGMCQ